MCPRAPPPQNELIHGGRVIQKDELERLAIDGRIDGTRTTGR